MNTNQFMVLRAGAGLLALFLLVAAQGFAQQVTGAITGTISDDSGAVVPGAKVTAVNIETGVGADVTTDSTGSFLFPLLRAGRYTVIVESPGFQRLERQGVVVNTTETLRLDLVLKLGVVAETITVREETPLLQSEQATMGHVVDARTITSIPLATRNFTQILGISAGVVGDILNADKPGIGTDTVSVNGARRGSNNLLVDGAPTANPLNMAPGFEGTPSIEFLGEFKVLTSLYGAEYGRNLGSNINVTTRSGSNEFHGAVYEFFRNTVLNARPFFNPRRGKNNQNQFGANLGGRIVRNKTFFFAGWESSLQRNSNSGRATMRAIVPTADQRRGDFGTLTIIDPSTGQPFPNNVIPASRLNEVSLNLQEKYIPLPNFESGAVNFFAARAIPTDMHQYTVRVDHQFGAKDSIFIRWFDSRQRDSQPFRGGLPGFARYTNRNKKLLTVNETHIFSSALVMEARFAYDWTDGFTSMENQDDMRDVGLKPIEGVTLDKDGIPRFDISDYASFGNGANWRDFITRYVASAAFTWVKSRHTIKYGVEVRGNDYHSGGTADSRGRFRFRGNATGDGYADFLMSYTDSKRFSDGPGLIKMRDTILAAYLSDDWKVTSSLTLSLGLRYEAHWQPAAYNFGMTNWYADRYTGVGSLESSGIVQGGVNGIPRSTVRGDWNNFMPRLGIAWRLSENWVIRTGAGLYFDQRVGQVAQQGFNNPPAMTTISANCNAEGSPCNVFVPDNFTFLDPGYDPSFIPFPTSPNDRLRYSGIDPDTKTDNAWQWNFSIQRQLPSNFLVEAAYVGTKGTHLLARRNFNPLIPEGFDPNDPKPGKLQRLYPGFSDLRIMSQNGNSTYHSFQFTLKRRVATGTLQLAYTRAKTLGNGSERNRSFTTLFITPWWDWSRAKGPANFDRANRLSLAFTQDLPNAFTRGAGKWLLNNWSVNGFFVIQSGTPLTVVNRNSGRDLGGAASSVSARMFSNVVAGMPLKNPGPIRDKLQNYINKDAWSKAPRGTVGNSGRGMFRGPGQSSLDVSLFKTFPFGERYRVQFRAEAFNVLNRASFSNPITNMDSAGFGQINSTSTNARLVQFALKFMF